MFDIDDPFIWVDYADRSYIATRLLSFTYFMFDAPVNAHRSVELYLKAYLVSNGDKAEKNGTAWGHNLDKLREVCGRHNPDFSNANLKIRVAFYQRYFDFVRYPGEPAGTFEGDKVYWLGFDSAVLPLDEVVAFVRPRINLSPEQWKSTWLTDIYTSRQQHLGFQKKALKDNNSFLNQIICKKTTKTRVKFDNSFSFDRPGC
jgi:HEPN domain-containing protein